MASRASKTRTNPLVLPSAGLAAMQRGNGHCYIESSFLYSRTSRGYITRRPCPRVLPRGHTTQRARWEIFKLSLSSSCTGTATRSEPFSAFTTVLPTNQSQRLLSLPYPLAGCLMDTSEMSHQPLRASVTQTRET